MSIALEARVAELEQRIAELERQSSEKAVITPNGASAELPYEWTQLVYRISELERTAARKPGPKPKEQA